MLVIQLWWILEKLCKSHSCLSNLPLVFLFIIVSCMWVHFKMPCVCKTINSHLKGVFQILNVHLRVSLTCATHAADHFHQNRLWLWFTFLHYNQRQPFGCNPRAVSDSKVFRGDGCSYTFVQGDENNRSSDT